MRKNSRKHLFLSNFWIFLRHYHRIDAAFVRSLALVVPETALDAVSERRSKGAQMNNPRPAKPIGDCERSGLCSDVSINSSQATEVFGGIFAVKYD